MESYNLHNSHHVECLVDSFVKITMEWEGDWTMCGDGSHLHCVVQLTTAHRCIGPDVVLYCRVNVITN